MPLGNNTYEAKLSDRVNELPHHALLGVVLENADMLKWPAVLQKLEPPTSRVQRAGTDARCPAASARPGDGLAATGRTGTAAAGRVVLLQGIDVLRRVLGCAQVRVRHRFCELDKQPVAATPPVEIGQPYQFV